MCIKDAYVTKLPLKYLVLKRDKNGGGWLVCSRHPFNCVVGPFSRHKAYQLTSTFFSLHNIMRVNVRWKNSILLTVPSREYVHIRMQDLDVYYFNFVSFSEDSEDL